MNLIKIGIAYCLKQTKSTQLNIEDINKIREQLKTEILDMHKPK